MGEAISWSVMGQDLAAQGAVVQAILLAATAFHKASNWQRSMGVVQGFARLPNALSAPALGAALTCEGLAALMLCVPTCRTAGALLAACLWSGYLVLIARAIADGRRDAECGCSFGGAAPRLGRYQIVRNAVLAAAAAAIFAVSLACGTEPLSGVEWLGGVGLVLLYVALEHLMATPPLRVGRVS